MFVRRWLSPNMLNITLFITTMMILTQIPPIYYALHILELNAEENWPVYTLLPIGTVFILTISTINLSEMLILKIKGFINEKEAILITIMITTIFFYIGFFLIGTEILQKIDFIEDRINVYKLGIYYLTGVIIALTANNTIYSWLEKKR